MTTDAVAGRNRALLEWYALAGRDLPWRRTSDPWAILVSEVMLQQTQVGRVVPVYRRFLERFPEPGDCARAGSPEVIAAWGHLGYLRRAYRLQEAARVIDAEGWPEPSDLDRLPGVGAYTAAAVAAFAFGVQIPSVDTNLRRVLGRWHGRDLKGAELREGARRALGDAPAADWNQAVMDLASSICVRARPRCEQCPVTRWCADPSITPQVPRQTRFEGSVRQARAAILRHLAGSGPLPRTQVSGRVGLAPETVETALDALTAEGLVRSDAKRIRLADQ